MGKILSNRQLNQSITLHKIRQKKLFTISLVLQIYHRKKIMLAEITHQTHWYKMLSFLGNPHECSWNPPQVSWTVPGASLCSKGIHVCHHGNHTWCSLGKSSVRRTTDKRGQWNLSYSNSAKPFQVNVLISTHKFQMSAFWNGSSIKAQRAESNRVPLHIPDDCSCLPRAANRRINLFTSSQSVVLTQLNHPQF